MANKTDYKRTLSGSVGAGMKSIFSAGGRSYYILEHKVSSNYHKAGESQEIIVDQVELGRDSKCQVRFDESFKTVSRRHAAIIKDGDRWKLVQLSTTNKTLLNGQPIANEWYLQNGDEIQLSVNGPKLGFIVPTGAKATVGSIGLSRRLSLFRQQALRPYKAAMWVMAVLIVLLTGGGSFAYKMLKCENENLIVTLDKTNNKIDSVAQENGELKRRFANIKFPVQPKPNPTPNPQPIINGLDECKNDVFFLVMSVRLELDGTVKEGQIGTGTGFLLNDGRFVTARHCVQPWMFNVDKDDYKMFWNLVAHNGGKMTCIVNAYSPDGRVIKFTSDDKVHINDMNDVTEKLDNGLIIKKAPLDCNDYAWVQTEYYGLLTIDRELSKNLSVAQELMILGYPLGLGADNVGVDPYLSKATVAKTGLAEAGYIATTLTSFEPGNSGGPVFAQTKDGFKVVGIVSAGAGRSTGFVVPILKIH